MTRRLAALLLLPALALAACGGSDDDGPVAAPPVPEATAAAADFPAAGSKSMMELSSEAPEGPILAPTVSQLAPGTSRFAFALFDTARKQLNGASVAVYVGLPDGSGVRGPFVARSESLVVKTQFRSQQTANDEGAPKSVYVADIKVPEAGTYVVMGIVRLDGRLVSTEPQSVEVQEPGSGPPAVGEQAVKMATPTRGDVAGNLEEIDTRVPPVDAFHRQSLDAVLGKKPVVLLFSTPQLCQVQVCGPVYDIAYQVQSEVGDDVEFIQMEIYNDNEVAKGFRPEVGKYRLPTEPWIFVMDKAGKIVERFEGAYSVGELQRAVARVDT